MTRRRSTDAVMADLADALSFPGVNPYVRLGVAPVTAKLACNDCGRDHLRDGKPTCKAHARGSNKQRACKNFPPTGSPVCRFHGGAAPQVEGLARARNDQEFWAGVFSMVEAEAMRSR